MKPLFSTFVPMHPEPKLRPRVTRTGQAYTPTKTAKAESRIQDHVHQLQRGGEIFDGPLAVTITVQLEKPLSAPKTRPCWPTKRPDADNYAKLVLDALNGILWLDDSQVVDLRVRKVYATPTGFGIEVFDVAAVDVPAEVVGRLFGREVA